MEPNQEQIQISQTPKKINIKLIIAIVLILLLVILGGGYYYLGFKKNENINTMTGQKNVKEISKKERELIIASFNEISGILKRGDFDSFKSYLIKSENMLSPTSYFIWDEKEKTNIENTEILYDVYFKDIQENNILNKEIKYKKGVLGEDYEQPLGFPHDTNYISMEVSGNDQDNNKVLYQYLFVNIKGDLYWAGFSSTTISS